MDDTLDRSHELGWEIIFNQMISEGWISPDDTTATQSLGERLAESEQ